MALTKIGTLGIADDAITAAKLPADSVGASELANNAVDTAAIAADAVDGTKIADNAINSEHYTDGSIDNAHLADNAVGLAEMAGLVRGKIIVGDPSGDPSALAMGTSEQVLRVNTAGNNDDIQTTTLPLEDFSSFAIKVVMKSLNTSKPPILRNFRTLALAV